MTIIMLCVHSLWSAGAQPQLLFAVSIVIVDTIYVRVVCTVFLFIASLSVRCLLMCVVVVAIIWFCHCAIAIVVQFIYIYIGCEESAVSATTLLVQTTKTLFWMRTSANMCQTEYFHFCTHLLLAILFPYLFGKFLRTVYTRLPGFYIGVYAIGNGLSCHFAQNKWTNESSSQTNYIFVLIFTHPRPRRITTKKNYHSLLYVYGAVVISVYLMNADIVWCVWDCVSNLISQRIGILCLSLLLFCFIF